MSSYKEEQELKARRKALGKRFRLTDDEAKDLNEQQKQGEHHDNIKYRKTLKRK